MNSLLLMTAMGGVMILIITLLRFFTQKYLHRNVFVILWILAMLRLCIPYFTNADTSFYNIFQEKRYVVVGYEREETAFVNMIPQIRTESIRTADAIVPEAESLRIDIRLIWLVGAVGVLSYFAFVHIRSHRQFRFAIGQEEKKLGKIRLARMEGLPAPLVYGLFRPRILLPMDFPEDGSEEYWHVLHHETMHVRHGDLWIKAIALVVVGIHWFNPCAWLMLFLLSEDLEMRCDQAVIRKYGRRKSYAMTLVQAEEQILSHLVHTCFAFSATRRRLENIARAKLNTLRSVFVCVLFATLLVACFGTRARAEQKVIYVTEEEQSGVQLSSTTPTVDLVEYTESTSATVAEEPVTEEPSEPLTEAPTVPTETEAITEPEMTESTTQATTAPTEWTPPATEPVVPEPESTEAPTTGNPDDLLYGELPYLGSFDLVVGETLSMDVSSYRTGNTSVSDPSAARVWKEESSGYGGSRARIYFAAYATGYVQVYGTMYVNDRSISWLLAELYISPNGDTESISFAETDGKVPTIEIPEFDFNFPNG